VELTSPVAARLAGTANGKVIGKANLRAYFARGLEAYAELQFRLEDVLWGLNSVVLYYANQKGTQDGGVYGAFGGWQSGAGGGELQRLATEARRCAFYLRVLGYAGVDAGRSLSRLKDKQAPPQQRQETDGRAAERNTD
jgi:hypothetical protein